MDNHLKNWISENYNIVDPKNCSQVEISKVTEISCKEKYIETIEDLERFENIEKINLSDNKIIDLDLSVFPKLRELDCSYCPIQTLNILNNRSLEYIRYEGLRGNKLSNIDFTGNPKLKKIIGGQDGLSQIDLSNNPDMEEIDIRLSQNLRHINVKNCSRLKKIRLWGVLVPYVDLTNNHELEHVEINYLNTFKGKSDEYGDGYPRPFIFVDENFDRMKINSQDLQYEYYTHVLIRVKRGSNEESVLKELNEMKQSILEVSNVASFHYQIMEKLKNE